MGTDLLDEPDDTDPGMAWGGEVVLFLFALIALAMVVAGFFWWRGSSRATVPILVRVEVASTGAFEPTRALWESWPGVERVVVSSPEVPREPCFLVRGLPAAMEKAALGDDELEAAVRAALGERALVEATDDGLAIRASGAGTLLDLRLAELGLLLPDGSERALSALAELELSTVPTDDAEPLDVTIEVSGDDARLEVLTRLRSEAERGTPGALEIVR